MAESYELSDDELPDLQETIDQHARKAGSKSQPSAPHKASLNTTTNSCPAINGRHKRPTDKTTSKKQLAVAKSKDTRSLLSRAHPLEGKAPRPLSTLPQPQILSRPAEDNSPVEFGHRLGILKFPSAPRATPGRSAKKDISYYNVQTSPNDHEESDKSFANESVSNSEDEWNKEIATVSDDIFNGLVRARGTSLQERLEKLDLNTCRRAYPKAYHEDQNQPKQTLRNSKEQSNTKTDIYPCTAERDSESSLDIDRAALLVL